MDRPYDKLLVLDLDETLVHTLMPCEVGPMNHDPHFEIPGGCEVYARPGVREFLASCFEKFRDVAVWTAGTRTYAFEVLPHLCDPDNFTFVWGRERCTWHRSFDIPPYGSASYSDGHWLKDIRKVRRQGFRKEKTLFVDDTAMNFKRSYGNLIHVRGFYGDPADNELEILETYLDTLGPVPNVRTIDKRNWRALRVSHDRGEGSVELSECEP